MLRDITLDVFDLFGLPQEPEPQEALLQPDPQWSREGGLYVIWLSPDRGHYYGGRTSCFSRRWGDHLKNLLSGTQGNTRFQNTFNKYRFFEPEVLQVWNTREEQIAAEQVWLDENFRKSGCVNASPWPTGGNIVDWTTEKRAAHSLIYRGRKISPGVVIKRRDSWKANPTNIDKARATLSVNRHYVTQEGILIRNRRTGEKLRGRVQPRSTVERRAASNRGRENTPETLALMSESAKKRATDFPTQHGPETRALISEQQRGRIWVNDGANNKRVSLQEASSLLDSGWVRGRLGGSHNKDRRLLVRVDPLSGEIQDRKLALLGDLPSLLEAGWENLPPKESSPPKVSERGHKGTVWVRREDSQGELECRRVAEEDLPRFLAEGWERGARKASLCRKEKMRTAWSDPQRIEEARQRRATQKNQAIGTIWVWRDGDGFCRVPVSDKDKWIFEGWVQRGPS